MKRWRANSKDVGLMGVRRKGTIPRGKRGGRSMYWKQDSGIPEIFALEFLIQLKESGISLTIRILNPNRGRLYTG